MSCHRAQHFEVVVKLSEMSVRGSVFSIMLSIIKLCFCGLICILDSSFAIVKKTSEKSNSRREGSIYHLQFEDVEHGVGGKGVRRQS